MIFVDSNIPMYIVGQEHSLKRRAMALIEELVVGREKLVTDAEVIQEVLHRYTAIQRREAIQPCIDALYGFIDEVFAVTEKDALNAKALVLGYPSLAARDAIHAAVMQNNAIVNICSFDRGFDALPNIRRLF